MGHSEWSRAPTAALRAGLRPPWTTRPGPKFGSYQPAPNEWHPVCVRELVPTSARELVRRQMVALDVPPQADLPKIRELLEHGETKEWWHWEEGCVTAAWEAAARA